MVYIIFCIVIVFNCLVCYNGHEREVIPMPISNDNQQVYCTLSKELVNKIDNDARSCSRTRSKQIEFIVKEHYRAKENKK